MTALPSTQQYCCFLDSSILVSNFFGKFTSRIERFLNIKTKYAVPCYISSSVDGECEEKINNILDFIGDNITLLEMRLAGEKTRTQHEIVITEQDIILVELLISDLFKELSQKAREEGRQVPEIEQQFLRILEESVVDFLEEKFKENASLTMKELGNFLAKCLDDFVNIKEAFRIQRKSLAQKKDITPDSRIVDEIKKLGIPTKDSYHIASAIDYAASNDFSAIFISVDYKTILNFREELYKQFKFQVCDPVYAYHHLKNEEVFRDLIDFRSLSRQSSITDYSARTR